MTVLILAIVWPVTNPQNLCPDIDPSCKCVTRPATEGSGSRIVIECVNMGVREKVPSFNIRGITIDEVIISGDTKLRKIDESAFADLNVRKLTLSGIGIEELDKQALRGTDLTLKELLLDNNQLTTLPIPVFSGVTNLKTLNLSNNNITSLNLDLFIHLQNLVTLDISDNELMLIASKTFRKNSQLESLHMQRNKLIRLAFDLLTNANLINKSNANLINLFLCMCKE